MTKNIFCIALGAVLFAVSFPVQAQQPPKKIPRIGILYPESAPSPRIEEFQRGLRELGYNEGQNIILEYRYADGKRERLPELAADLVRLNVNVIFAPTTLAASPAKNATSTIPIVMVSGEPVETGLVASFAHPGGNVTGLAAFSPDLIGKRLEILKQVVPQASRVGVLWDSEGPAKILEFKEGQAVAPTLGIQIQSLPIQAPSPDIEGAFKAAIKGKVQALVVLGNPLTLGYNRQIVELATRHRLPSISDARQFVEVGGLVSYGPNFSDVYRRAAIYVDKILKGAKPADLPVEQPTKFEFVINLKAAKQIGLTIPPNVLARADKVIR
jgi:putative tryptophan/tyrosine transport system substrate-binding protein